MTDTARTEVMARIRHATRGASAQAIAGELQALGRSPVAELPAADLPRAFLANVLKNQGTVDVARNRSEAVKAVGHYLYQHHRSHRIVAGNDPRLAAMPWRDGGVLPRFGAAENGEPAALSYARVGVAEAGAIVTFTGKANPAANNLLAEHHLVLVNTEDLVPDLETAWERISQETDQEGRPRGVNFIAGPSSTADIEGQLVYGAHGPRSWHVILIGELEETVLDDARTIAGA
jgi:L-lactate dehydrogenase complex protein LldG